MTIDQGIQFHHSLLWGLVYGRFAPEGQVKINTPTPGEGGGNWSILIIEEIKPILRHIFRQVVCVGQVFIHNARQHTEHTPKTRATIQMVILATAVGKLEGHKSC